MDHFTAIPCEVVEHIAFFLATDHLVGPPSDLLPLLQLNSRIYNFLSFENNPHLYSRIFEAKFDTASANRYFGPNNLSVTALAGELKRRCLCLTRIRDRLDCVDPDIPVIATSTKDPEHLQSVIWTAYLMMVENDGKNEEQLRDYAKIEGWIRSYWFNEDGTSFARVKLNADLWPRNTPITAASMWLLWLFFRPEDVINNKEMIPHVTTILKLFALGAHRYSLVNYTWNEYSPPELESDPLDFIAYGEKINLTPLPVGTPATLAYLSLYNKIRVSRASAIASVSTLPKSSSLEPRRLRDCAWQRGVVIPRPIINLSTVFKTGSVDGVWEGMFTYAEFTSYTEILRGGPPSVLSRSLIAQHRQTWKIREHVLLDSSDEEPLSVGEPLRAFVPDNVAIKESSGEAVAQWAGESVRYVRSSSIAEADKTKVKDIIITGDGHSAWGQFKLQGRVRHCDGFVILTKEYLDGDRGHWLYRGHIVGGNFVGRWRDTMSPANLHGYEGCFVMNRRG